MSKKKEDEFNFRQVESDNLFDLTNISSFENEDGKIEYSYTEDQYTIPEYLKEVVTETEESLGELSMLLAVYQAQTDSAIAELSIALGGNNNV